MLSDLQDAYGPTCFQIIITVEKMSKSWREKTGFIDVSRLGPFNYFAEYENWAEHQRNGNSTRHRQCLGYRLRCGAALPLPPRKQGHDVLGTDISPLAIQTCQSRGLENALVTPITQLSSKIGIFDTILMMGHNFGLVGSYKRAKWILRRFAAMTTGTAKNYR